MPLEMDDVSRQRLDFSKGPNGETLATLTITLPDGSIQRFQDSVTEGELDAFAEAVAKAELQGLGIEGEIEGFGDFVKGIRKAVKKVSNSARKIAASKVFRQAGQALMVAGPIIPQPFGAAAMAVGGGMQIASKVAAASVAAKAGAKRAAKKLGISSKQLARKLTGNKRAAKGLLKYGNAKRKSAERVADRKRGRKRKRPKLKSARGLGARRRAVKAPDPVRAARAGKLRSNKPGPVTQAELLKAAKAGRVFWS